MCTRLIFKNIKPSSVDQQLTTYWQCQSCYFHSRMIYKCRVLFLALFLAILGAKIRIFGRISGENRMGSFPPSFWADFTLLASYFHLLSPTCTYLHLANFQVHKTKSCWPTADNILIMPNVITYIVEWFTSVGFCFWLRFWLFWEPKSGFPAGYPVKTGWEVSLYHSELISPYLHPTFIYLHLLASTCIYLHFLPTPESTYSYVPN